MKYFIPQKHGFFRQIIANTQYNGDSKDDDDDDDDDGGDNNNNKNLSRQMEQSVH